MDKKIIALDLDGTLLNSDGIVTDVTKKHLKKLKEDGHEIYIITARGSFLSHSADVMTIEENRNIVLNWLKINLLYNTKDIEVKIHAT